MAFIIEAPLQVHCSGSDCTKTKLNVAIKTDHEREGQRDIQGKRVENIFSAVDTGQRLLEMSQYPAKT